MQAIDTNRQLGLFVSGEIGERPGQADLFSRSRYALPPVQVPAKVEQDEPGQLTLTEEPKNK